jgi:hypothetical protein
LERQTASALGDAFQILFQALTQTALGAGAFLGWGGHAHQRQGVFIPSHKPIQRREHGERIGAVGLDAFVLVVPVARADDMIGHAQGGELPVQAVTKRSGFVAGNNLPALADLFFAPTPETPSG